MAGGREIGGFLLSEGMQIAAREIDAAIASTEGVLICGESGTGREAVARAVHQASRTPGSYSLDQLLRSARRDAAYHAPFVVVDCAQARDIERHIFGTLSTAAAQQELDRISDEALLYQALGGTLFLRSLQDMPGRLQARLARILRDREVWVDGVDGGSRLTGVSIRAIACIDPAPDDGDERIVPELRKKLAGHRIHLPPIRNRREDIPGLIRMLLADICEALKIPPKTASSQAMALLAALPWRGNFKEMRGLLRTLVLKAPGRLIRLSDVLENIRLDGGATTFMAGGTLKEARDRFEREYVAAVLEQHHGRMAEAARVLGIQRTNLYRKVRQLSVARKRPGR